MHATVPSAFSSAEAYLNALHARMGETEFSRVVSYLSARLNVDVTRAGLKPSARVFLSGLLDKLRISCSRTLRVQLTTRECEELLGLGSTSCTEARNALIEAGLVERDGNSLDLSPWAMQVMQFMPSLPDGNRALSEKSPFSVDSVNSITITNKLNTKKEGTENETSSKTLTAEEILHEAREAISLSPRLLSALTKKTGRDMMYSSFDELVVAIGSVLDQFLPLHKGVARLWDRAISRHGHVAILALIAALEDTSVRCTERWFRAFVEGMGAFAAFADIKPNLARVRAERDAKIKGAEAQQRLDERDELTRKRSEKADIIREQAEKIFVELEKQDEFSKDYMLPMACARSIRLWLDDEGQSHILLVDLYQNTREKMIKSVANILADRLNIPNKNIGIGFRSGAIPLL